MKSLDKLRECRVVFIRDGKSVDPVELADEIQRELDEGYEPKPVGYELLPCPMCGHPFAQVRWIGFTHTHNGAFTAGYRGECCDCGLTTRAFDNESEAVAAWNMRAESGSEINGDTSDGYHTFDELYRHRAVLFSVIVRDHRELAWKARKHHDGTMYDGMFIVGIETPMGQATYHYDIDPYWEMFDCEEREFAPEWDGHTPDEAIARIAALDARAERTSRIVESRYHTLFGTPERAAFTLAGICEICEYGDCATCGVPEWVDYSHDYDALLEWLSGDAE